MKTPIKAFRNFIENDMMQKSYTKEQLLELIDLLLIETVFDTLNAKAALFAIDAQKEKNNWEIRTFRFQ